MLLVRKSRDRVMLDIACSATNSSKPSYSARVHEIQSTFVLRFTPLGLIKHFVMMQELPASGEDPVSSLDIPEKFQLVSRKVVEREANDMFELLENHLIKQQLSVE